MLWKYMNAYMFFDRLNEKRLENEIMRHRCVQMECRQYGKLCVKTAWNETAVKWFLFLTVLFGKQNAGNAVIGFSVNMTFHINLICVACHWLRSLSQMPLHMEYSFVEMTYSACNCSTYFAVFIVRFN